MTMPPVRVALVEAEELESWWRNQLAANSLTSIERISYELRSAQKSGHIDDRLRNTGLNSSEVLATLFELETSGIIR